ncbi:MAG: hypothetical protein IAF38_06670 [Bacteroidia bacterium]|nr:hypothetical protein [Bacteroidia bacterium]
MKTLKLITITLLMFVTCKVNSQVTVNVNIGSPPQWGPVGSTEVRYYYLPDVESYYDVPSAMFIYYEGGVWVHRDFLPVRYKNYDLFYGYKVVITDYRDDTPYIYFVEHKKKYKRGYRGKAQKTIGNKPVKVYSKTKVVYKEQPAKKANVSKSKSAGNGNEKSVKKEQGHGGGKGKKK